MDELAIIQLALSRLKDNPFAYLTKIEYKQLDPTLRENWYQENRNHVKVCSICFGRTCHIDISEDPIVPCPYGTAEIIDVTDNDRYIYRFTLDRFLLSLQEKFNLAEDSVEYKHIHMLGSFNENDLEWQLAFTFGQYLDQSIGDVLLYKLRFPSTLTLLLVDDLPNLHAFEQSVLINYGVYVVTWYEGVEQQPEKLSSKYEAEIKLRQSFTKLTDGTESTKFLLKQLEKTATAGNMGDEFEDAVFTVIKNLFQTVIPFGAQFKGFAVPDGLATHTSLTPLPVLFYDCKSFKGPNYKDKPQTAMQANYYQDFLADFFHSNGYENLGFVIFSSHYPDDVKAHIRGSSQWQYVQNNCTIFFVDVESMMKAKQLLDEFSTHSNFDHHTFLNLCFLDQANDLKDTEVQGFYSKLFPASVHDHFRFVNALKIEIAIVAAFLAGVLSNRLPIEEEVTSLLKQAKHDNLTRKVRNPLASYFLRKFADMMKEDENVPHLHPLSVLLISKRFESNLCNACGEALVERVQDIARKKMG